MNEAQVHGDKVILRLDANAVIGEDISGLDKLIREERLYGLALNIPNTTGDPPGTYQLLGRFLDYILGTDGTRQAVVGGGSFPYNTGTISYHWVIFIDFQVNALLGQFEEIALG